MTQGALLILHGGWDTIFLALLYWTIIFIAPAALLFALVRWILQRRADRL
jgi:hypothetical protein